LARSGGIPAPIAAAERKRLANAVDSKVASLNVARESTFDTAQRLITGVRLHASECVYRLRHALSASQRADGGWPASLGLLVPHQRDPDIRTMFADDRRLLSTAMSVLALAAADCA
jgi:hypothetical protein